MPLVILTEKKLQKKELQKKNEKVYTAEKVIKSKGDKQYV